MKEQDIPLVRSLAVIGQGAGGKTTLCEALLYSARVIDRLGNVIEGTSTMDFEPEEIKRNISISAAISFLPWKNHKVNLIDTPGFSDFVAEAINCLRIAGAALVVIPAVPDLKVQTENLWNMANRFGLPRALVITMMDRERADFFQALKQFDDGLKGGCLPLQLPLGKEQDFRGVIDLVSMQAHVYKGDRSGGYSTETIPDELKPEAQEYRLKLVEKVAEGDDALLEKYLEEGEISDDELRQGLKAGTLARKFTPVLACSGLKNVAVQPVLDLIISLFPSPAEEPPVLGKRLDSNESVTRGPGQDEPFSALVFKTVADPFAGKLSLFRVYSGTASSDAQVYNSSKKAKERIGQILKLEGKRQKPVAFVGPGEIAGVAKLKETATGDTLCDEKSPVVFDFVPAITPVISFAVEPKSKADEDKVSTGLARMKEEDPVLRVGREEQTKEIIVSGLGQMHVETVVEKLKRKFGVELVLRAPKVPYRETIKGTVQVQGKYKRQSGGRGQYGDTWLELSPVPKGKGFEFVDSIAGGAIPKQYIPAVEKGILEAMEEGVLAGYPVVDVMVNLYDGSYHSVDSSDMAFKIAGSIGFKKGFLEANPVLLEPIMEMEITVPDDKLGDVIGDLNSRRGRVLGVETRGKNQRIKAHVPMAEVLRYASDLRSMTSDRGEFIMQPSHYEEVPAHLAEKIIAESKKEE